MKFVINKPVVDLRKEPLEITCQDYSQQFLRESQLLFGELVCLIEEHGDWLHVKAIEQPKFDTQLGWHAYPGWIKKDEIVEFDDFKKPNVCIKTLWAPIYSSSDSFYLSCGSFLCAQPINDQWHQIKTGSHDLFCKSSFLSPIETYSKSQILETVKLLINQPYLWGGRAAHHPTQNISSVDCSGLVNLAFRANGWNIPRDAHDQYLQSVIISRSELQPADLLFFMPLEKQRVTHVVMYLGNHQYIEAPYTGSLVRIINEEDLIKERGTKNKLIYGSICRNLKKLEKRALIFE